MTDRQIYFRPSFDHEGKWYPDGPADCGGYYGTTCYPHTRFDDEESCAKACRLMDIAYAAGFWRKAEELRDALGVRRG